MKKILLHVWNLKAKSFFCLFEIEMKKRFFYLFEIRNILLPVWNLNEKILLPVWNLKAKILLPVWNIVSPANPNKKFSSAALRTGIHNRPQHRQVIRLVGIRRPAAMATNSRCNPRLHCLNNKHFFENFLNLKKNLELNWITRNCRIDSSIENFPHHKTNRFRVKIFSRLAFWRKSEENFFHYIQIFFIKNLCQIFR